MTFLSHNVIFQRCCCFTIFTLVFDNSVLFLNSMEYQEVRSIHWICMCNWKKMDQRVNHLMIALLQLDMFHDKFAVEDFYLRNFCIFQTRMDWLFFSYKSGWKGLSSCGISYVIGSSISVISVSLRTTYYCSNELVIFSIGFQYGL